VDSITDGAQLDGKFHLSSDVAVAMWKAVGPHNQTLRATVSLQHCLPVYEETLSLEHGRYFHHFVQGWAYQWQV